MADGAGIIPPALGDAASVLDKLQTFAGGNADFTSQFNSTLIEQLFSKLDNGEGADKGDKKISAQELAKALGVDVKTAQQLIDNFEAQNPQANGDHSLQQSEFVDFMAQLYKTAAPQNSQGGDGGQQTGGSQQSGGGQQADGGPQSGSAANVQRLLGALATLLDTNGDGKVDESELQDFIKKYAGDDGKLSKEELQTGLKALAQQNPDKGVNVDDIDSLFSAIDSDSKDGISPYELTIAVGKGSASAEADQ